MTDTKNKTLGNYLLGTSFFTVVAYVIYGSDSAEVLVATFFLLVFAIVSGIRLKYD